MNKQMMPVQTDRQTHRQTVDPIILSHPVAGINKKLSSHEYLTTVYLINKSHNKVMHRWIWPVQE